VGVLHALRPHDHPDAPARRPGGFEAEEARKPAGVKPADHIGRGLRGGSLSRHAYLYSRCE